jgi:hypothetical protein
MAKRYGPRPLSWEIEKLTKPVFRKRGFGEAAILTEWETVVGPVWARHTCPEKLARSRDAERGAVLHLRVESGPFATELIHSEPQLIQRINNFYGYNAVERVKITQGPLPKKERRAPARDQTLSPGAEKTLSQRLDAIEDPELRAALEGLGRGISAKEAADKKK